MNEKLTGEEEELINEIRAKIRELHTVNFEHSIELLRGRRHSLEGSEKEVDHYISEFCYHMISVLIESQKLIGDEKFSSEYIAEHCDYLSRLAKIIGVEGKRDYDIIE